MQYIHRYLERVVKEIHTTFKVLYLGGPRQVGKTTLLRHMLKEFNLGYVTFDDLAERRLAVSDPELFFQRHPGPLLIDEVQYATPIFPVLKSIVDKSEKRGQFWLTGSQQFAVIKNLQESLAGRVGILSLLGLSQGEEASVPKKNVFFPGAHLPKVPHSDLQSIFKRIFRGSFPGLIGENAPSTDFFYNSYIQTYIDRDLRDIFGIAKISEFHTFLSLCAARTGQICNISSLATDARISVNAAREWLNILEQTNQIFLLRPFARNISKRLIRTPKLYFLDTGLAAYLSKWKSPETLASGAMAGAFFETYVISEIVKSYLYRGEEPPLSYYRDKEKREVDLIIERENALYPIEIKMAARIEKSDAYTLSYFKERHPTARKTAIVSFASNEIPLDRDTDIIPVGMIT